jgi:ADP-ribose pyrophosphatase YjhB (NUDIX family)
LVDDRELITDAAKREVREETGLEVIYIYLE